MTRRRIRWALASSIGLAGILLSGEQPVVGQASDSQQQGFRFKSGVELINVTATVTDRSGRFVSGLRREDFRVFEDGAPVEVTHFSAERTPVSLGIVLDTSGSMAGEKIESARTAIFNFLQALPDPDDEFFLYRFTAVSDLVHDWTRDREAVARTLNRVRAVGGTAMYDALAEAVPHAQSGRNRKKAIVVISDGNDTNSQLDAGTIRQLVRQTEVLVYAIGIDSNAPDTLDRSVPPPIVRPPVPIPFPLPGGRGLPAPVPVPGWPGSRGRVITRGGAGDPVNVAALREITDDSGGRTEVIRDPRELGPATARIADELSRQYYLGYPSPGHRDGRWHSIDVEVRDRSLHVRARRGYVAPPGER